MVSTVSDEQAVLMYLKRDAACFFRTFIFA